jgi:hypothetical protein
MLVFVFCYGDLSKVKRMVKELFMRTPVMMVGLTKHTNRKIQ